MNPQNFGRDAVGIPDHFWLKFWHQRRFVLWHQHRFALSEHSLVVVIIMTINYFFQVRYCFQLLLFVS